MRLVQNVQMEIGEIDVANIKFDPRSRDDMPRILKGLQYLYTELPLRNKVFQILEAEVTPAVDKHTGRPGMTLWRILVCGVVRLDLNLDYDRLHDLVSHHTTLRAMLGYNAIEETYSVRTLRDNVSLLTPELLDKINLAVVEAGHVLVKKSPDEALHGRCDSFVLETHVHYPTDINLLFDAMRKVIELTADLCERLGDSSWRQYCYNIKQLKRLMQTAQNKKRSKAQSETQKNKNNTLVIEAHQNYLNLAQQHLDKAIHTLASLKSSGLTSMTDVACMQAIDGFMTHAKRQIDQTKRRVILGETIPHEEKVFSIFQEHTEWISKGKAGVPVELGVKVCIIEDQHQFILHHQVMEKTTDDQVAVSMVKEAKARHPALQLCSFDKGFHSKENQQALKEELTLAVLPRKGKLSKQAYAEEHADAFIKARRQHSAVVKSRHNRATDLRRNGARRSSDFPSFRQPDL